ncbi:unnamed protein product [Brassica rapa]|uniref:Uncharacterized protein n=1 Tax=Brassica campestris TaxID=3711 RepID=A0A8D9LUI2_BRACM|nr:unnamed protein product [Brassica rapa]
MGSLVVTRGRWREMEEILSTLILLLVVLLVVLSVDLVARTLVPRVRCLMFLEETLLMVLVPLTMNLRVRCLMFLEETLLVDLMVIHLVALLVDLMVIRLMTLSSPSLLVVTWFIENHHHQPPQPRLPGGAFIEELNVLDAEEEGVAYQEKSVILGKRGRSSSEVETEEDIAEERRITHMQNMNANAMVDNGKWQQQTQERRITNMHNMHANAMVTYEQWQPQTQERRIRHMHANAMVNSKQWQPQTQSYSFQSSTVTYGGHDGNYYTSSTTRRTGSDGLTLEESKEANTATREAAHRISRGFHNRGHTVERTRNSDGRVGTNQILHNLNEGK